MAVNSDEAGEQGEQAADKAEAALERQFDAHERQLVEAFDDIQAAKAALAPLLG